MAVHRLDASQTLPIPLAEAWDFFSDPRNLALITPPWMQFTITGPPLPARVYEGMIITYTVRPLLGIPLRWVAEITHLREGEFFVDEQRAGPYSFWHHQHFFRPVDGGTEIQDIVHYAAPFGPLGDQVVRFQVRPRLEEIFRFRREVLERRFANRPPASPSGGHA